MFLHHLSSLRCPECLDRSLVAGNRSRGAVKRTVENRALRQSQASGNNSRVRAVRLSGIEKQAGPR